MKIILVLVFLCLGLNSLACIKPKIIARNHQNLSEEHKIEKLILIIKNSNVKFIRNGSEYSPKEAAEHPRMKRRKAGSKIKTAKDFIDHIASKSYMSGEPYQMKFRNGSVIDIRDILYHELKRIEK
ncbi:MAG: DUF5329 family protein [Bacteroidota bacterium]